MCEANMKMISDMKILKCCNTNRWRRAVTTRCNCTPEFSGEPGWFLPFHLLLPMRTSQSREWWAVVSCGSWLELLTSSAGGDLVCVQLGLAVPGSADSQVLNLLVFWAIFSLSQFLFLNHLEGVFEALPLMSLYGWCLVVPQRAGWWYVTCGVRSF